MALETRKSNTYNGGKKMKFWTRIIGRVNRNYKDRLFIRIFSDKDALLRLYNAVNGTNYSNAQDIQINTIDDYLYMGMKNDISFLFTDVLNLYEHQSTFNPNMPLRGFLYLASLYQKIFDEKDLFSSKLIELPSPQLFVFYNGTKEEPDRMEMKLSDAFIGKKDFEPCLECKAIMLNINSGHNEQIMGACKELREYATFISLVRKNLKNGLKLRDAIDKAVDECIEEGILRDLFLNNRKEVVSMLLMEYDQEAHIRSEKNISFEEGVAKGIQQEKYKNLCKLIKQILKNYQAGKSAEEIADILDESEETIRKIVKISEKFAPEYDVKKIADALLERYEKDD